MVPPKTPTNIMGIGVLKPLAMTSGRNMLSSRFTRIMYTENKITIGVSITNQLQMITGIKTIDGPI